MGKCLHCFKKSNRGDDKFCCITTRCLLGTWTCTVSRFVRKCIPLVSGSPVLLRRKSTKSEQCSPNPFVFVPSFRLFNIGRKQISTPDPAELGSATISLTVNFMPQEHSEMGIWHILCLFGGVMAAFRTTQRQDSPAMNGPTKPWPTLSSS